MIRDVEYIIDKIKKGNVFFITILLYFIFFILSLCMYITLHLVFAVFYTVVSYLILDENIAKITKAIFLLLFFLIIGIKLFSYQKNFKKPYFISLKELLITGQYIIILNLIILKFSTYSISFFKDWTSFYDIYKLENIFSSFLIVFSLKLFTQLVLILDTIKEKEKFEKEELKKKQKIEVLNENFDNMKKYNILKNMYLNKKDDYFELTYTEKDKNIMELIEECYLEPLDDIRTLNQYQNQKIKIYFSEEVIEHFKNKITKD